jgi:hypothetical protein
MTFRLDTTMSNHDDEAFLVNRTRVPAFYSDRPQPLAGNMIISMFDLSISNVFSISLIYRVELPSSVSPIRSWCRH